MGESLDDEEGQGQTSEVSRDNDSEAGDNAGSGSPPSDPGAGQHQHDETLPMTSARKKIILQQLHDKTLERFKRDKTSRKFKTDYWDSIYLLREVATKKLVDGAQCIHCDTVFSYSHATGSGTKSFGRHLPACLKKHGVITDPNSQTPKLKPPTAQMKYKFVVASAEYCADAMKPPETFASHGMQNLIQKCLEIGYGNT